MAYQIKPQSGPNFKSPRIKAKRHMGFVAQLPSLISFEFPVEVAHVRFSDKAWNKVNPGMQQKPSDFWTVPLSPRLHRLSKEAQHTESEREFWEKHNIDVLLVCDHLWASSGDLDRMKEIIGLANTGKFPW